VRIQSVSAWPKNRGEIDRVVEWTAYRLRTLSSEIELVDVGQQILPSGQIIHLPKVLLGTLGKDASKKTVLVYGNFHVKPALKENEWNTNPFELTEVDGKLLGCAASDDKGPVLCWVHATKAYIKHNIPLPLNVKFVFEGMEKSGIEGLDDLLMERKNDFLADGKAREEAPLPNIWAPWTVILPSGGGMLKQRFAQWSIWGNRPRSYAE